jgi:hypothetical protein
VGAHGIDATLQRAGHEAVIEIVKRDGHGWNSVADVPNIVTGAHIVNPSHRSF